MSAGWLETAGVAILGILALRFRCRKLAEVLRAEQGDIFKKSLISTNGE
jgi:hypothetical protein